MLSYYLSLGGELVDEENQIILNEEELTLVYARIKEDVDAGVLFSGLSQITSHGDARERYKNGEMDSVIVPGSFPLSGLPEGSTIVPITSLTNYDYTLAKGWTIALADPLPERRELAVTLAESLTEVVFMGQWSEALNLFPVRETAFEHWQTSADTQPLSLISFSAHIYPTREIIRVVSPALQAGVSAILNDNATPEEAALIAIGNLTPEE